MVTLIIVRHGFSQGNKEKLFAGQLDVPLDEVGQKQAISICEHIVNHYSVDAIYSSNLCRAYDTVRPLATALSLPIAVNQGLCEIHQGNWQGSRIPDIAKQFPDEYRQYKESLGLFPIPGGETYAQVMARATQTVDEIARRHDGQTVVLASHGGWILSLFAAWDKTPLEKLQATAQVPNGSISVVRYQDGTAEFSVRGLTDHLTDKVTEEGVV